jgi:hypothetical protein
VVARQLREKPLASDVSWSGPLIANKQKHFTARGKVNKNGRRISDQ